MSHFDRSGRVAGILSSVLLFPSLAVAGDAHADKLLTVADDGLGVLATGSEVRLVAEKGVSFGDTGFGKSMGLSVPLSPGTRTAVLEDPDAAWGFGFKAFFELGYDSATAFEKRVRPVRLKNGWDTSLSPASLCRAAEAVAAGPGTVEGGFVGWLDQRAAISDLLALGDLGEALAASRTLERSIADGVQVDYSDGALSAWVWVAHHLGEGRTQVALDVAEGANDAGVVIPELSKLLRAGLVEDAGDVASTLPPVDCGAADASLLASLTSRDLAAIAAGANRARTHSRATRAALLALVDGELCARVSEDMGTSPAPCAMAEGRLRVLGVTPAEVVGGDLDLDELPAVDEDRASFVDRAAGDLGRAGSAWADAFHDHFRSWSPGVAYCMNAPADRGVGGPRSSCDPADPDASADAEQARWEQAVAAWEAAQGGWAVQDQALEEAEIVLARYATREALLGEMKAIEAAVDRRRSIETDLELVEDELETARPSQREELEARKLRFAKELAEDLLLPGAADRDARLTRITQELAAISRDHGPAIDALPDLLAARAEFVAAEGAFRRAEARRDRHEDAWKGYRRDVKTAPYASARSWARHVARNVVAPHDLRGPHWSAGLQVAGGYDRLDIHLGALHPASVPRQIDAFFVELGAQGSISAGPVTLQARVGVAIDQVPTASRRTFCRPAMRADDGGPPDAVDQECTDVAFISSRPQPRDSGYVRFGALLLSPDVVPGSNRASGFAGMRGGLDLRFGLEDLGRSTLLEAKVTVLAFPTLGPMKGRYGVGFRSRHHLTPCDASGGVTSDCGGALQSFAPFVFLGGSFGG